MSLEQLHNNRYLDKSNLVDQAYASDYLQDVQLEYAGYWNGQHWAKLNDAFIPIEPISPGFVQPGDPIVGSLAGRSVYGRWMP